MKHKTETTIVACGALALAVGFSIAFQTSRVRTASAQQGAGPPDTVYLGGVVRDFTSNHPDFAINNPGAMGHAVGNVSSTLGSDGRPVFTGAGKRVTTQWYDKDANPIQPYSSDLGLPGGHFDVDVYDAASTNELYHEHEFDDKFDVTHVDVANDPLLLFDSVIGDAYPNDLRLEFDNVHNGGGGTYVFEAGSGVQTGITADGFTATFTPDLLTQLRVNFIALDFLRPTDPGTSQDDVVDRDDSFTVRMYDVVTNVMVYEVTVYHHFKENDSGDVGGGTASPTQDACGVDIVDSPGVYGAADNGAITDAATFDQWFRDDLGTNQSAGHEITLQRDANGVYEYMTDSFFPIDNRLMGNGGDINNNFFTYSITATFTYNQCTDQFFQFESNDDAWVFIDNQLVLDIGGVSTPERQYVALDRLGLVDGQEYTLSFFYAHRRESFDSFFHMRTNLELGGTASRPTISPYYD